METINVVGRSNAAHIEVRDIHERELMFDIQGGEVRTFDRPQGRFWIEARHENGTDGEHDSAKVALLEGYGFAFDSMWGGRIHFTGVITEARWYDNDQSFEPGAQIPEHEGMTKVEVCNSEHYHPAGSDWPAGHLLLPYTPPERKWKARPVQITVHVMHEGA